MSGGGGAVLVQKYLFSLRVGMKCLALLVVHVQKLFNKKDKKKTTFYQTETQNPIILVIITKHVNGVVKM